MSHNSDTDDDFIDLNNLPKRSQTSRRRKAPSRFGVSNDNKEETSSNDDFSASDDESLYIPPSKKLKDEMIRNLSHSDSDDDNKQSDSTTNESVESNNLIASDFNVQFEQLSRKSPVSGGASAKDIEAISETDHGSTKICDSMLKSTLESRETTCTCNNAVLEQKMDIIDRNLKEVLVRFAILERILIKDGTFNAETIESPKIAMAYSSIDPKIEAFRKSNNLPIENSDTLKQFQTKLENDVFEKSLIDTLLKMTARDYKSTNAPLKTLKTVLCLLIHRRFLAVFTWTGKSTPGTRKIPLRDQKRIVDLLYTITSYFHKNYAREQFKRDLIDKILKFTYDIPQKLLTQQEIETKTKKKDGNRPQNIETSTRSIDRDYSAVQVNEHAQNYCLNSIQNTHEGRDLERTQTESVPLAIEKNKNSSECSSIVSPFSIEKLTDSNGQSTEMTESAAVFSMYNLSGFDPQQMNYSKALAGRYPHHAYGTSLGMHNDYNYYNHSRGRMVADHGLQRTMPYRNIYDN